MTAELVVIESSVTIDPSGRLHLHMFEPDTGVDIEVCVAVPAAIQRSDEEVDQAMTIVHDLLHQIPGTLYAILARHEAGEDEGLIMFGGPE